MPEKFFGLPVIKFMIIIINILEELDEYSKIIAYLIKCITFAGTMSFNLDNVSLFEVWSLLI